MVRLVHHKPKSYKHSYTFWKSLEGLTIDELKFLIYKRRRDMKNCTRTEYLRMKTEMAILRDAVRITKLQIEGYDVPDD